MADVTNSPLEVIAAKFRAGVEIKDRKYRFSIYKNCFVGKEAVDFMIEEDLANTRHEAVQVGMLDANFLTFTREHCL